MEEGKRRTARRCRSRKGTGQCEKGTLLPSELSGIGAATLQQTGDSLANEDSHDSDHSSEHAHLWYRQGTSSILRKEMWWWQALLEHRLHRERTMTLIFNIIKFRHPESVFFMIYRRFYTKCHLRRMLPQRRWRWIFQRCWSCVWQWAAFVFAFACTEN